jgi:hypothetical protein
MPRRPKKGKSSDLLLRKLIGKLDPIETTLLRERIVRICEMSKQDMLMNPDKYSRGIIASHLLEAFYNKCLAQLSYESRDSAERAPSTVTEPVVEEKEELVIS